MKLRIEKLSNFRALGLFWGIEDKEMGIYFFRWELLLSW